MYMQKKDAVNTCVIRKTVCPSLIIAEMSLLKHLGT